MIDFHSHILPEMDDGAENVGVSLELLRLSAEQGVEAMVATPHFYPHSEDPTTFLKRRKEAVDKLFSGGYSVNGGMPRIYLGAEVAYYPGIGSSSQLSQLCIAGTRTLLLEMPFCRWSDSVIADVFKLKERAGIQVVIAHVERYIDMQRRDMRKILLSSGVLLQSNAEYFIDKKTSKKALGHITCGEIQLLGSDCHNTEERTQNIGSAVSLISASKYGDRALAYISDISASVLKNAIPLSAEPANG